MSIFAGGMFRRRQTVRVREDGGGRGDGFEIREARGAFVIVVGGAIESVEERGTVVVEECLWVGWGGRVAVVGKRWAGVGFFCWQRRETELDRFVEFGRRGEVNAEFQASFRVLVVACGCGIRRGAVVVDG